MAAGISATVLFLAPPIDISPDSRFQRIITRQNEHLFAVIDNQRTRKRF
ncbi:MULTISPECIES: hypothetical protein [Lactobacillaceae]|nr:hypothetical protein [Loigolactobacillus backii]